MTFMLFVIAYDISNDRRREQAGNLLLDYGDRVQYSVYEAELTPSELQVLRTGLGAILGPDDRLAFYPLCGRCRAQICDLPNHSDHNRRAQREEGWYV